MIYFSFSVCCICIVLNIYIFEHDSAQYSIVNSIVSILTGLAKKKKKFLNSLFCVNVRSASLIGIITFKNMHKTKVTDVHAGYLYIFNCWGLAEQIFELAKLSMSIALVEHDV